MALDDLRWEAHGTVVHGFDADGLMCHLFDAGTDSTWLAKRLNSAAALEQERGEQEVAANYYEERYRRLREAIERNVVGRAREVAIGRPVAEVLIRYEMRDGESPQDTMCRIMRLTEGKNDGYV